MTPKKHIKVGQFFIKKKSAEGIEVLVDGQEIKKRFYNVIQKK